MIFQGQNTLAYLPGALAKSLDNINIIKHFSLQLILRVNKLECFLLESL